MGETWDGWGSISVVFFPLPPPLTGPTADVCDLGDERDRVSLTTKIPSFSSWHFAVGVHLIQRPHSSSSVSSSSCGGAARTDVKSTKSNALKTNIDCFLDQVHVTRNRVSTPSTLPVRPPPPSPPLHTKPLRIAWISPALAGRAERPMAGCAENPMAAPRKSPSPTEKPRRSLPPSSPPVPPPPFPPISL